ncbi:alpha/beta fold hydrolase [Methyloversatilis sp.]|uniref:alpha/beta fold hydrolase n=1 Tax=Methyloversatilis sp. TaxID=2569862 RepID=UPI003F71567E
MPPAQPVLFLHANGYPAGVYRQFLAALARHHPVSAIDVIAAAHGPGRGWRNLLTQVLARVDALPDEPLVLVGHSMGGYLAAMTAARRPTRVAQVVLIDAPLVGGWRSAVLTASHASGLSRRFGPAPIAARRRMHWPSRDDARQHLAGKPFVQRWAPGVLDDFLAAALTDHPDGGVTLTIAREAERDIYATLAHRAALRAVRTLRRRGTPIGFVAGSQSEELRLAGRDANRAFWGEDWHELDTGHLVPMEAPQACAAAVHALLGER